MAAASEQKLSCLLCREKPITSKKAQTCFNCSLMLRKLKLVNWWISFIRLSCVMYAGRCEVCRKLTFLIPGKKFCIPCSKIQRGPLIRRDSETLEICDWCLYPAEFSVWDQSGQKGLTCDWCKDGISLFAQSCSKCTREQVACVKSECANCIKLVLYDDDEDDEENFARLLEEVIAEQEKDEEKHEFKKEIRFV